MSQSRKKFLKQIGSGLLFASLPGVVTAKEKSTIDPQDFSDSGAAEDEKYWSNISRKYYDVSRDYVNLENGYYGLQSKPVFQAFLKNTELANSEGSRYARREYPDISSNIKKKLASFLNVSDEEIIIVRNATEALNIAIQGYSFSQDDEVVICQLDYASMVETFRMLEKRGKIKINQVELPLLPANEDKIIEKYRQAITDKTKVMLLTHVSNINGLIPPVAKIAAMAKAKGIDTITDSAHALGQIPFSLPGLGSDFVGMNLHKWIGNPIGAGVLYVKKDRIKEMNPFFGDVKFADTSIRKLAHIGTTQFAVTMTIPDSLAFRKLLGVERINKRLHYLKSSWVNEFINHPTVELVSPTQEGLTCAIASFRIRGKNTAEVADYLFKEHKILTVRRDLGEEGCIRVTPAIYNSVDDVKKLVSAINAYIK